MGPAAFGLKHVIRSLVGWEVSPYTIEMKDGVSPFAITIPVSLPLIEDYSRN